MKSSKEKFERHTSVMLVLLVILITLSADGFTAQQPVSVGIRASGPPKPNGRIAFAGGNLVYGTRARTDIYTVNPDGTELTKLTGNVAALSGETPLFNSTPAWSPDGKQIAFTSNRDGNNEIYTMNFDGSDVRRLTTNSVDDASPVWSPDGSKIAFYSSTSRFIGGETNIFVINADGTNSRQLTIGASNSDPTWSPDGKQIAYGSFSDLSTSDIYVIDSDGGNKHRITDNPGMLAGLPAWSPDGTRIVYSVSLPGILPNADIYMVNIGGSSSSSVSGGNVTRLTRAAYSGNPSWSPDGTKIVFMRIASLLNPELPRNGVPEIYVMSADGSNQKQLSSFGNPNALVGAEPEWGTLPAASSTLPPPYPTPFANPIDDPAFFVRQHYLDFLNRQPEPSGLNEWVAVFNRCAANPECLSAQRIEVSAAFFRSDEFQQKGFLVWRFYAATLGRRPRYTEITADIASLTGLTTEESAAQRAAFAREWVERPEFRAKYDRLSNTAFIDELLRTADVSFGNRQELVNDLNLGRRTRTQIVREIVESQLVFDKEYNRAFVAMQYFGYLRRDPDERGYTEWLRFLTQNPLDYRTMVGGFVTSTEYRLRFGQQ